MDTGFRRHISLEVKKEGDRPSRKIIKRCKELLGEKTTEKWFDGRSLGYPAWLWVIGVE